MQKAGSRIVHPHSTGLAEDSLRRPHYNRSPHRRFSNSHHRGFALLVCPGGSVFQFSRREIWLWEGRTCAFLPSSAWRDVRCFHRWLRYPVGTPSLLPQARALGWPGARPKFADGGRPTAVSLLLRSRTWSDLLQQRGNASLQQPLL